MTQKTTKKNTNIVQKPSLRASKADTTTQSPQLAVALPCLIIPEALVDSLPSALQNFPLRSSYRLSTLENEWACESPLLCYAPSVIFVLALNSLANGTHKNCRILTDKNTLQNKYSLWFLQLRLKNEKRRMGSDVPSPLINRILRHHVHIADYFSLSIGQWLKILKTHRQYFTLYVDQVIIVDAQTTKQSLEKFCQTTHKAP